MPVIKKYGFKPFDLDLCLFKHRDKEIYLILYVDDLLVSAKTVTDIREL
jgi:hypothetical protein